MKRKMSGSQAAVVSNIFSLAINVIRVADDFTFYAGHSKA